MTTSLLSRNPATGEIVGEVAVTPLAEVAGISARARAAQPSWQALGVEGRVALLRRADRMFAAHTAELAKLITKEMGKPLSEATAEVESIAAGLLPELDEIVDALAPDVIEEGGIRSVVHHDPFGVCAAITPWNFPMAMSNWMVLPALAAGNTVVFKPSEETPLCGQAYADTIGAHLPRDVLQVVHGADDQGKALVASGVDMIAFTGSREAGKHILQSASGGLKRIILELGGKDPLIVLEDADLAKAARFAAWNSFRNAGQVCISTERIFVHHSVADRFESLLVEEAGKWVIGSGLDPGTKVGPMVNTRQREHVLAQIEAAVSGGAKVLAGTGSHPDRFIIPTVLSNVTGDMAIARDETFGPVACITRVGSDDEAVAKANASPFGLGAVVFGEDEEHAGRVARRLSAGMIGINRECRGARGTPWVGARESGFGFHKSREGHRQFTQTRVISARRDRPATQETI